MKLNEKVSQVQRVAKCQGTGVVRRVRALPQAPAFSSTSLATPGKSMGAPLVYGVQ